MDIFVRVASSSVVIMNLWWVARDAKGCWKTDINFYQNKKKKKTDNKLIINSTHISYWKIKKYYKQRLWLETFKEYTF